MKVLVTGGAGFVGSQMALRFKADDPAAEVVALDNLRRRGAELNLPLFKEAGVAFVHGDVRNPADLEEAGEGFDLLVDAAAEPSVLAGLGGSPLYLTGTNLGGTLNCLEYARRHGIAVVFLSTSRVYSIEPLRELKLRETPTRFELDEEQELPGVTPRGISEDFPTHLPRSLYGATKLASELMVQEYVHAYGIRAVINRCGVIAGAGQFGKVDQGVFTMWVANHFFRKPLSYTGFGGHGKQVRDLLHPADLYALLRKQVDVIERVSGETYNVGGGREVSTSLLELTELCREVTGNTVPVRSDPGTNPVDVPLYVSDSGRARGVFGWEPAWSVRDIVSDIFGWMVKNEAGLRPIFG